MRKLKELRLHSLGLSQHQIARSCAISQSTVHEYVSAAQAAGLQWPLPEGWGDQQIEQALFPQRPALAVWRKHPEPDWSHMPPFCQRRHRCSHAPRRVRAWATLRVPFYADIDERKSDE